MEEKEELIDQSQLAEDVSTMIPYDFFDFFLVKPLEPIKVKKEFSKPVVTGTSKDKDGIEAQDFDKVETEVKEVNSDYRKGVVIKTPKFLESENANNNIPAFLSSIKPGDIILFRDAAGLRFDLLKDSRLLKVFDVLGIEVKK